jgi:hypothetical protein
VIKPAWARAPFVPGGESRWQRGRLPLSTGCPGPCVAAAPRQEGPRRCQANSAPASSSGPAASHFP